MAERDEERRYLPAPRRLLDRVRGAIEAGGGDPDDVRTRMAMHVVARAERIFDRLEGVTTTLERAAKAELSLVERLGPIVDDLGELVKLRLTEARRRLGRGEDEG